MSSLQLNPGQSLFQLGLRNSSCPTTGALSFSKRPHIYSPPPGRTPKVVPMWETQRNSLSCHRRVCVREFKGKLLIDIRELYEVRHRLLLSKPVAARRRTAYYLQKNGEWKPGLKGLALSPEQWELLRSKAAEVSKAVEEETVGFEVDLRRKQKLAVSAYKSRLTVDLREYYDKNGGLAPGATIHLSEISADTKIGC